MDLFKRGASNAISPMAHPSRRVIVGLLTLLLLAAFLFTRQPGTRPPLAAAEPATTAESHVERPPPLQQENIGIDAVTNDTLGFPKIFVVGLPERSDRRDALVLTGALTGFHMEFVDGVRGETIPDKAIPSPVDRKVLMEANLGSWRGHMNAIRRIIDEDLESALIMEDDVDWDVRLKKQLKQIAVGARTIMPPTGGSMAPYGNDWDVLWLGHCGEIFPEVLPENVGKPEHPKYTISNDETVPPLSKVTGLVKFADYPEFTRWVHIAGGPICTFAYAVSQRGARKILYGLGIDRLGAPVDNALADFCRDGASGNQDGLRAKCISITPPLFFHHRAKGRITADSDIQNPNPNEMREKGTTENIVWSARNNMRNMLLGLKMENQFEG